MSACWLDDGLGGRADLPESRTAEGQAGDPQHPRPTKLIGGQ